MSADFPFRTIALQYVPRGLRKDVLRALLAVYPAAYEHSYGRFAKEQAKNNCWNERRTQIESQLLAIASRYQKEGVEWKNESAGPWNQVHVICGGAVILTANRADGPDCLIEPCFSREQLAYGNDDVRFLLPDMEEDHRAKRKAARVAATALYAVLLHGGGKNLEFAVIRFLRPDQQSYHPDTVDLFREFPEVVRPMGDEDVGGEPNIDINPQGDIE